MTRNKRTSRIIIIAITTIVLSCLLCNAFAYEPFMDQIDRSPNGGDFYPEDYYSINPNTIITDLDNGLLNIFSPIPEPPDSFWAEAEYESSIEWNQSDFVKTATALNRVAGTDHISDWDIHHLYFTSPCKDYIDGFLEGHFILFRPLWMEGRLYYKAREIVIDPSLSIVRWGDGRAYPRPILGWNKIELDKFKITADEALAIAEENGGKELRLDNDNKCIISVIGRNKEWIVLYSPYGEYQIDGRTGKIIQYEEY